MNLIEEKIFEILDEKQTSKFMSQTKSVLNSSGQLVTIVNVAGDNIKGSIKESVGGLKGKFLGKLASTTTKVVGGLATGVIAGTLKTVAFFIPDGADPKKPENDAKISAMISTFAIPEDKENLVDLLLWLHQQINAKEKTFGEQTIKTMKSLHLSIYDILKTMVNGDKNMINWMKAYAPSNKFGLSKF